MIKNKACPLCTNDDSDKALENLIDRIDGESGDYWFNHVLEHMAHDGFVELEGETMKFTFKGTVYSYLLTLIIDGISESEDVFVEAPQ
ncbi:MAG: hypothetical protein QXL46_04370 [Nitrososphaerales archaeon]